MSNDLEEMRLSSFRVTIVHWRTLERKSFAYISIAVQGERQTGNRFVAARMIPRSCRVLVIFQAACMGFGRVFSCTTATFSLAWLSKDPEL